MLPQVQPRLAGHDTSTGYHCRPTCYPLDDAYRHHLTLTETVTAGSVSMLWSLAGVTMTENVVAGGSDGRADGRVALQRHGAGEEGAADVVLLEDAQEAPDDGAAAVLEERLVSEVPSLEWDRRGGLTGRLALADAVLEEILRPSS